MKLHATIGCFILVLASLHAVDAPKPITSVLPALVDQHIIAGTVGIEISAHSTFSLGTFSPWAWVKETGRTKAKNKNVFLS